MKSLKVYSIALLTLFNAVNAIGQELIRFDNDLSITYLESSKHKVDFFKLSNYFIGQPNGVACGPTTASIILNALKKNEDEKPLTSFSSELSKHIPSKWDPRFKRFTPDNFFTSKTNKIKTKSQVYGEPIEGKQDFGLQLRQLHEMLIAHGLKSKIHVVTKKSDLTEMKKEIIKNLETANDYVVINYSRKALGQKGGGHISPLVAYNKEADVFLIMDVNPNKDQWVWVKYKDLVNSMNTHDTIENRGYLLISN